MECNLYTHAQRFEKWHKSQHLTVEEPAKIRVLRLHKLPMPPQSDAWITIEVSIEASNERLLEGLDVWLRLGLISDAEVRRLCCQHLCCTVPVPRQSVVAETTTEAALALSSRRSHEPSTRRPLVPVVASRIAQVLQSLMAEFSLMWLLLLGVFMVVVSSGILAVSQWRQFPSEGQYLILLGYTLAFWVVSAWTGKQENLRLTARMLKTATLLIIPVNFWMIDGLKLWKSGVGWAIAVLAALVLTAITIRLLKISTVTTNTSINARQKLLTLINSVGLSWLHWGWGWASFPITATYIGTVGTALSLFYQYQSHETPPSQTLSRGQFSLGTITIASATLLLLARAIFVTEVPVPQLGLALGICGWLFCWLSRQNPKARRMSDQPLVIFGVLLLLVGWLVSVTAETPWQAVAVSGLGLWLLVSRLRRRLQVQDLTAIFLVGLQLVWLVWRLLPVEFRQNLIVVCIQLAGTTFMPWALVGVAVFPYLVLTLLLAARLRRWQQLALANHAELLALLLGLVLTSLSLANPLVRSLNLLLSSLTLAVVTRKHPAWAAALIYATHVTGLAALTSGIDLILPNLGNRAWTGILLGMMVAEWLFSVGSNWQLWRRSAWHIGLGLAAISYSLLLREALATSDASVWSLIGLTIPVTLTAIANHPQFLQRHLASWLSVLGFFFIQPLTFDSAVPRLTSLGIATILMLLNTQQLQYVLQAVLTVGFGLAFSGAAIWQVFSKDLSIDLFVNILVLAALALWLLRQELSKRNTTLLIIYTQATDGWATSIASLSLLLLTIYDLYLYTASAKASGGLLLAATLITVAIGYRTWQQSSNLGFYGTGWGMDVLVAGAVTLTPQPLVSLAIANLALGLTSQLAGDWWNRRFEHNYRFSWHVIPLIYAGLGFLFQHRVFTASTGLFTLGAAFIGMGIGRRCNSFKFLTYFSLLGVSVAAYELLVYQLLQVQGGSIANGLVLLAGLGTVIAISERWLTRWLSYLRLTNSELHVIAHLHWVSSSGLVGLALLSSPTFSGVLVIAVLGLYALFQARYTQSESNSSLEAWTYAGIIEAVGAISFLLDLVYPDSKWLIAWSAAITCVFAYGMYTLPWDAWGWLVRPWRRSAYVLPGLFIYLSIGQIAIQSLLIVAAFYAWLARTGKVRLSYISIILADWAIVRLFGIYKLSEPLWYATLLGGSLLYMAQVDPGLQTSTEKEKRHLLRCLATGLICLTAVYQSEASMLLGLLTVGFSIGFILSGLALRIRAFLYVGTVTFIIQVLRQIWFFINDYSFLLWAMGIVLGIAFIWVAANFESRREQTLSMLQGWVTELDDWD